MSYTAVSLQETCLILVKNTSKGSISWSQRMLRSVLHWPDSSAQTAPVTRQKLMWFVFLHLLCFVFLPLHASRNRQISYCVVLRSRLECQVKCALYLQIKILRKLGSAAPTNNMYNSVKMLLERVAPAMIDRTAIEALITMVDDAVRGLGEICDEIPDAVNNGMKLLLVGGTLLNPSSQNQAFQSASECF